MFLTIYVTGVPFVITEGIRKGYLFCKKIVYKLSVSSPRLLGQSVTFSPGHRYLNLDLPVVPFLCNIS